MRGRTTPNISALTAPDAMEEVKMFKPFQSAFHQGVMVFLAIVAGLLFAASDAPAKEKKTMKDGVSACKSWCVKNNKTVTSQSRCYRNCELYWACNGSDSTETTCSGVKNATLENPKPPPSTGVPPKTYSGAVAINPGATAGASKP
jgi:hypothetical protein